MAPSYYLKPETALSKAKELIKVGKKQNALELLYDIMKLKRGRVWHKNLQDLMLLFVDLCVELKKNAHFRKVIYQYKGIVVQECPQSMELVLNYYLSSIKKLTEEAHQKSKDAVLDIEDLDALDSPESLMLNAVNTEGAQDRSDRAILMPWLRFLWESYRLVLDLLRTMSKFEPFYYEIAREAYEFCIKYSRKNEFKKLTEAFRLHSTRNQWQSNQTPPNSELQNMQLQIRLKQLETAMDLEMYNDAFKAVEDIWTFLSTYKKASKILIMKEYCTRLSDLFLRSGCHLFHAAALLKLMNLAREHKKTLTKEEMTNQASQVLCAILAIPLPQERMNFDKLLISGDSNAIKMKSLSNLLGLPAVPTRQLLIRDFLNSRVMGVLPQELIKMFSVFEKEFQPLKMYELVKPGFDLVAASPDLNIYLNNLQEICISKTVLQVSQVFRSIKFEQLFELCPMVDHLRFERILVELIHNLELPIRVDYRVSAVHFDVYTDMGISQRKYGPLSGIPGSQQFNYSTDQLTRQLNMFGEILQAVNKMLPGSAENLRQQSLKTRQSLITDFQRNQKNARKKLTERRDLIEQYKKKHAQMEEEKAKYVQSLEQERREQLQREQEEDERRLQEEAREREKCRAEEEAAHFRRKLNRQHINNLIGREAETIGTANKTISANVGGISLVSANMAGTGGVKKGSGVAAGVLGATVSALKNITDEQLDQLNANDILEKKRQEVMKRNRELKDKAKQRAQNLDYLTRAMRLTEMPFLQAEAITEAKARREFNENLKEERDRKSKEEYEQMLQNRDRLKRLIPQVADVRKQIEELSSSYNTAQADAWKTRCDEERTKRLEERRIAYEEEIKREEELKKQELERLREEEATASARRALEAAQQNETEKDFVLIKKSDVTEHIGSGKYLPPNLRGNRETFPPSSAAASAEPEPRGIFRPRVLTRNQPDSHAEINERSNIRDSEPIPNRPSENDSNQWFRGNTIGTARSSGFIKDDYSFGQPQSNQSTDHSTWRTNQRRH